MQLYVIENVCAQLLVLKASRNSNKLKKKTRIHQKGDLCNSLRIKLFRLEGETFKSHNKVNFNDKVQTHGLLILLNILLKFRIKNRLLPIAAIVLISQTHILSLFIVRLSLFICINNKLYYF